MKKKKEEKKINDNKKESLKIFLMNLKEKRKKICLKK